MPPNDLNAGPVADALTYFAHPVRQMTEEETWTHGRSPGACSVGERQGATGASSVTATNPRHISSNVPSPQVTVPEVASKPWIRRFASELS